MSIHSLFGFLQSWVLILDPLHHLPDPPAQTGPAESPAREAALAARDTWAPRNGAKGGKMGVSVFGGPPRRKEV